MPSTGLPKGSIPSLLPQVAMVQARNALADGLLIKLIQRGASSRGEKPFSRINTENTQPVHARRPICKQIINSCPIRWR